MNKQSAAGIGSFLLVAGFVWIVFDNLALGLIFGLLAGAGGAAAAAKAEGKRR